MYEGHNETKTCMWMPLPHSPPAPTWSVSSSQTLKNLGGVEGQGWVYSLRRLLFAAGVSARRAHVVKGAASGWLVNVHSSGHQVLHVVERLEPTPAILWSSPWFSSGLGCLWPQLSGGEGPWTWIPGPGSCIRWQLVEDVVQSCHHSSWFEPETQVKRPVCVCIAANDKLLNKAICPLRTYNNRDPLSFHLEEFWAENSTVNVSTFH